MARNDVHKLKLDDSFEGQKRAARMVSQGLLMHGEIKGDPTKVLSPEVEKEAKERVRRMMEKYGFLGE